jgi:hypothetical protein
MQEYIQSPKELFTFIYHFIVNRQNLMNQVKVDHLFFSSLSDKVSRDDFCHIMRIGFKLIEELRESFIL